MAMRHSHLSPVAYPARGNHALLSKRTNRRLKDIILSYRLPLTFQPSLKPAFRFLEQRVLPQFSFKFPARKVFCHQNKIYGFPALKNARKSGKNFITKKITKVLEDALLIFLM